MSLFVFVTISAILSHCPQSMMAILPAILPVILLDVDSCISLNFRTSCWKLAQCDKTQLPSVLLTILLDVDTLKNFLGR